ncbi:protein FAM177A1 [Oryzias melastigma]|uniref:Protein FAM177A1-like n=1 Tax=Oryzias melastigma TaxID=30732 RepID=A0A3B3DJE7_ORYME|nr:protein FAM177A1 [Oryzias melastigma]
MNNQELTEIPGSALSNQRKILHFSSGETLEVEDSTDEELSEPVPFEEPAGRTRLSFKNVALLVGRISLLACDFLGEKFAGVFGLNAAKYQYAIDRYHREHKIDEQRQAETLNRSPGVGGSSYGATADVNHSSGPTGKYSGGYLNQGYQGNKDKSK